MTAQAEDRQATGGRKGVYVYGILPGDIEVEPGATGVGDPPGEIRIVRRGDLAALVSDVDLDRALGRAADLFTHEELLDASAADVPVLPLRFGAVVSDDDAVAGELLGPHHDEFAAALRQLEGQAEFVVRGRYVEHAILREVLTEQPAAAQLSEQVRDADPDATREQRMQLGEIVTSAIDAKRKSDTEALGDALSGQVTASVIRPPTHELDAVYAAFLVENETADALRQAVDRLADEWRGRIELQLAGPLAAYDFVADATASADVPTGAQGR
jgi:Gas vesicle synthesis protein GvpL/GvpF